MSLKLFLLFLLLTPFRSFTLGESHDNLRILDKEKHIENLNGTKNNDKIKIHVVQEGETLSSIASIYSIKKELIIKANNIVNENYIFAGQNLKIIDQKLITLDKKNYHIVKDGENLTEISKKYELTLNDLIKINNILNPKLLKVGTKLKLRDEIKLKKEQLVTNKNRTYGPLLITSELSDISKKNTKLLRVTHINGKDFIISIKCDKKALNVRGIGRKWKGLMPAKTTFEKQLINDLC
tara:strand:- start:786 stop:1499 length:714 start_codon:yes stop_codon:yes gene_type:complete